MNKLWNYEDYVEHLSHPNRLLRGWAFEALEKHYPNRYTDEISILIGDEDPHLACAAPRYLAKHTAIQHAPKILESFKNDTGNVPSNCASALGKMGYEPAIEAILEYCLGAPNSETLFGALEYFGKIKQEDCRELLKSVVMQMQDSFELHAAVYSLLQHHNLDDVQLILNTYIEWGIQDDFSDSLLKAMSSALGGDDYYIDLTEYSQQNILEKPGEAIDLLISRNPTIVLHSEQREIIAKSLASGSFEDFATMIMFDARNIIHDRYSTKKIPEWHIEIYNQDATSLCVLEEIAKRPSIWKNIKKTKYAGRNFVALVLAVFFGLKDRETYLKALSPDACVDDLIHALTNTGSNLPESIQNKIKELKPISELNAALTDELMTWGDIWTIRLMKQIGSSKFVPELIRVLNKSDSMDYIYSDALSAMNALDESADESIIAAIKTKELGEWESFAILEHLPYSEAYDLAIERWNDAEEMDSYEIFGRCLRGIGDPRGLKKLKEIYEFENDATYIGNDLECLAVLHNVELPELPEIRRERKKQKERQKAREEEFNELAANYSKKKADGTLYHPGQILPFKRETPKVGRNEPCPCGSGKKYKKCCLTK